MRNSLNRYFTFHFIFSFIQWYSDICKKSHERSIKNCAQSPILLIVPNYTLKPFDLFGQSILLPCLLLTVLQANNLLLWYLERSLTPPTIIRYFSLNRFMKRCNMPQPSHVTVTNFIASISKTFLSHVQDYAGQWCVYNYMVWGVLK